MLFKFALYIFLLKTSMPCNAAHCMAAEIPPPPPKKKNSFSFVVSKGFSLDWSFLGNQVFLHSAPRAYFAGCKSLLSDHGNQCLNLSRWNPSSVPNNYYCYERSKEVIWSRNCLQVDEHFLMLLLFCRSEMNDEESKRVLKMLESNVRFWLNRKNLLLVYFWINEPNKFNIFA